MISNGVNSLILISFFNIFGSSDCYDEYIQYARGKTTPTALFQPFTAIGIKCLIIG